MDSLGECEVKEPRKQRSWRAFFKKYTVIISMVISYILVGTLLIAGLSGILTGIVTRRSVDTAVKTYQENMRQISNTANFVLKDIYDSCFYTFRNDPYAKGAIQKKTFHADDIVGIRNLLTECRNTNPLIDSVYFINTGSGQAFTSYFAQYAISDFNDPGALEMLKLQDDDNLFVARSVNLPYDNKIVHKDYISFCFSLSDYEGNLIGGMVVNLDQEEWQELFQSDIDGPDVIYVLNQKGDVISSSREGESIKSLRNAALYQLVQESPEIEGDWIGEYGGRKSLAAFQKSDRFGMIFLRITPYAAVTQQANEIKNLCLLLTLGFIVVGWVISLRYIRKIYKPIYVLIEQIKGKVRRKDAGTMSEYEYLTYAYHDLADVAHQANSYASHLSLRKQALYTLLKGEFRTAEERTEELKKWDIRFPEACLWIVVVRFDHFEQLLDQYQANDIALLRYAAVNIASELFSGSFVCEGLENGLDYCTILLNGATPDGEKMIEEKCRELLQNMDRYFQVSMSTGISERAENIDRLKELGEQALDASEYRVTEGTQSVIFYREIVQRETASTEYAYDLEKTLLEAVKSGILAAAEEALHQFSEKLRQCCIQDVRLYLMQLTSAFVRQGKQLGQTVSYRRLTESLDQAETVTEKFTILKTAVMKQIECLDRGKQDKKAQVLALVLQRMQEEYADPGCSIEALAEESGYSASYIRKLFKEVYQCSPNDCLLRCRMEAAQCLLQETNDTAKAIAEKVGYSNAKYFYGVFKKYTGMTAYEYREQFHNGKGGDSA